MDGHLLEWALGLGFFMENRWLSLGTVLPAGAQKHLWDFCVWIQGEIQCDQRNPEPNVALRRSRGQTPQIITRMDEGGLGRDRVWDDTQSEGQGLL